MRPKQGTQIRTIVLIGLGVFGLTGLGLMSRVSQALSASPVSPGGEAQPASDLVIHEWGTFLSMSSADGSVLDGMYHEEHALPSFVHARSRDQLRLPSMFLKGETPVIYFYTQRPQTVRLGVGFPKGIWTQWYPQAARVIPSLIEQAESPDRIGGGRICWYADIIPPALVEERTKLRSGEIPTPPATRSDALWNFARDVDAAYVKSMDATKDKEVPEYERFLFYRGLGEAHLPLRLDASQGGTLTLDREPTLGEGIKHVFVLRVEKGRAAYRYLPQLRPGETVSGVIPTMDGARPAADFTRKIADDLAARLVDSGLFAKEARAMVNTWSVSYFQTDGIRVLFVLPQSWTDAFIPMDVNPAPQQVVRVMVGRLELLSREREQLAEAAIEGLASPDASRRSAAFAHLRDEGRYVEPIIRRVLRTTKREEVRLLCRRLLMTEFVTALRAAVHNAADGRKVDIDPLLLRAHLARLLREVGLDRESRAEAVAVLHALEQRTGRPGKPSLTSLASSRSGPRRSRRRALTDPPRVPMPPASRSFANTFNGAIQPGTIQWCRDWWVGRAYGLCLVRAGKAEQTAADLEARLDRRTDEMSPPERRLSRLLLAYVHEAQGKQTLAERSWASLASASPPASNVKVANRTASP